jgi:hypothetical protein
MNKFQTSQYRDTEIGRETRVSSVRSLCLYVSVVIGFKKEISHD